MGELSVKIKIGDREYPMRVKPEEEAKIRTAGRAINEKIRLFREQFGISDYRDLLAMVAFDCMVEKMSLEKNQHSLSEELETELSEITDILHSASRGFTTR